MARVKSGLSQAGPEAPVWFGGNGEDSPTVGHYQYECPLGRCAGVTNPLDLAAKRLIDVVGALLGLIVLSPVFIAISIMIMVTDGGFPFFRQERIGQYGRPFKIIKFRSMRPDAEAILRANPELWEEYVRNDFKLPEGRDPRVTPIGRWLRKTSLDELPQLWNVLTGDMSLVGPRPLVRAELEKWYPETAQELLSVRPGMTGLWQISGRSNIGYPERANLELHYVRTRSLREDLRILLRTVSVVLRREGAH